CSPSPCRKNGCGWRSGENSGRAAISAYWSSGPSREADAGAAAGSGFSNDGSSGSGSIRPPMPAAASSQASSAQPATPASSQVGAPAFSRRIGGLRTGGQVAVEVEGDIEPAVAGGRFPARAEVHALGEDVEVVHEQPRRAALQR